jgi:hypothetical protein
MTDSKKLGRPNKVLTDEEILQRAKEKIEKQKNYVKTYKKKHKDDVNKKNKIYQKRYLAAYKYVKQNLPEVFKKEIEVIN